MIYTSCAHHPPASLLLLMSSNSFWSDACANAESRPIQVLLHASRASCSVTVTHPVMLLPLFCSVTCHRADCSVWRERSGQWRYVFSVAADAAGGPQVHMEAVRVVLRLDAVR